MKFILFKLITSLCIVLAIQLQAIAQENLVAPALQYAVHKSNTQVAVTSDALHKAQRLTDLQATSKKLSLQFNPQWIRDYVSVSISTMHNGKRRNSVTQTDVFSPEQKENMKHADAGAPITVEVRYMPENTLSHNDIQHLSFNLMVQPEMDAMFTGGNSAMDNYIRKHIVAIIQPGSIGSNDLVAVLFTISESGKVINSQIFDSAYQSYSDESTEAMILKAIQNMPAWTPATYPDGTMVSQDFVFTIGNLESCVMNLLAIQRD
jgi:hypothetical protein